MKRLIIVMSAWIALASCLPAQAPLSNLPALLNFERGQLTGGVPAGWGGGPAGTIFADSQTFHGGQWSARIDRTAQSPGDFSSITSMIPIDFGGKTVELHGYIRLENVSQYVGLWMREDGDTPTLAFDNMQTRAVKGTVDWREYSIVLPLVPAAKQLYFGFLLAGTGKAWVDDMRLLVDGAPVWEAPKVPREKTVLDPDLEFAGGSRIRLDALSAVQTENLATLGKVWGFLKYHHPAVTSGKRHWDYDLLRVLPSILAAGNRAAANAALLKWITDLGSVAPCAPCASLNTSAIHLRPNVDWISNETLLGKELSSSLRAVYVNRSREPQFYVSLAPEVGNPIFEHELGYHGVRFPDAGFQLLAAYRYWSIIEYWFPYRDVLGEDWDAVLRQFIPRIALAQDSTAYQRELMALIARAHDTHSNLWSSLQVRPPTGACQLPVTLRFVGNEPVIIARTADGAGFEIGDVLTNLNGSPISALLAEWEPYYADSNQAARLRDTARQMTRGACGETAVRVRRYDQVLEVRTRRVPVVAGDTTGATHDQPGETFRLLSPEVGYVKLSSVKVADAASYVDRAAGTQGLVIDLRNYPSEFVVFALGSLLVEKPTPFVRFTNGDLANPGAFHWGTTLSLTPANPRYSGKVVILVDEITQSSAEYHAMAFRASPRATVIGSTTAGADGNVSQIPLPGGFSSMISGIGVFYPDKRPTQRVGIVPDMEVRPTIDGIRAGRDEVLEAAVEQIVGPKP